MNSTDTNGHCTSTQENANSTSSSVAAPAAVQVDHLIRAYIECTKCNYVCHLKCFRLIRIDCQPSSSKKSDQDNVDSLGDSGNDNTLNNGGSPSMVRKLDTNNNQNRRKSSSDSSSASDIVTNNSSASTSTSNDTSQNSSVEDCLLSIDHGLESKQKSPTETCDILPSNDDQDYKTALPIPETLITPKQISNLKEKILKYNERVRSKGSGLGITLMDENKQSFRGFLRVHMNLTRPINVVSGKRPPSIYDIINEEENNNKRRTLTSFYMPRDTVKNIHITSDSTSLQVIKAMLKKFKVVDNPQKFALYLRRRFLNDDIENKPETSDNGNEMKEPDGNLPTIRKILSASCYDHSLKRLLDQELPLVIQLEFDSFAPGSADIVLQENDNADIAWDAFEVPELKNFLRILDREEAEHLCHVQRHYQELKQVIHALIEYERSKLELDPKNSIQPSQNDCSVKSLDLS